MTRSEPLPVNEVLPDLQAALRDAGSVVLRAPPGAGKTTLVPLAMLEAFATGGKIALTQPRRLAARTAAARLAQMKGSDVGGTIGYHVRLDRRAGNATRLIAMTTGILLRRLLSDPYLDAFSCVILDEFHERTLEMDLVLGLLLRLQQTVRPELKILVMSATIDCGPIAEFLGNAPVIESPGKVHEVQIRYARSISSSPVEEQVAEVLPRALSATDGHLLVFLAGVGEITRTARAIERLAKQSGCTVLQLYGDLSPVDQDRVLAPAATRKIILATNVAETSLTIDGVTGVIDSGWVKVMRHNSEIGLPRLNLEANSLASADQRAGRAGRQAPGVAFRLWPESMNRARPEFDTPEILRGDLSSALLQLVGMGEGDFEAFPWLTPPRPEAIEAAEMLLEALGAIRVTREKNLTRRLLTATGKRLLKLPLHPRLARLLVASQDLDIVPRGALTAALLSERDPFRVPRSAKGARAFPTDYSSARSDSDLVDRVARLEKVLDGGEDLAANRGAIHHIAVVARDLARSLGPEDADAGDADSAGSSESGSTTAAGMFTQDPDTRLRYALWEAYPDRLCRRRQPQAPRGVMVGGRGVKLGRQSNVLDAEWFVGIDVEHRERDAEVRVASAVDLEWIPLDRCRTVDEHFFHPTQKSVQARRRTYWLDLLLMEKPIPPNDPVTIASLLYEQVLIHWKQVFPLSDPEINQLLNRIEQVSRWLPDEPWPRVDEAALQELARESCVGKSSFAELNSSFWKNLLQNLLPYPLGQKLNEWAPTEWQPPSGNRVPIVYERDRPPRVSVRIQELFGLTETPRIARGRVPLLLELLGPNYRPQQLTPDLASFWVNTYPVVRKELARRYPKHHWPDDPATAVATRSGLKRDGQQGGKSSP